MTCQTPPTAPPPVPTQMPSPIIGTLRLRRPSESFSGSQCLASLLLIPSQSSPDSSSEKQLLAHSWDSALLLVADRLWYLRIHHSTHHFNQRNRGKWFLQHRDIREFLFRVAVGIHGIAGHEQHANIRAYRFQAPD